MVASIVAAPLVLLRSPASMALGVRWFKSWEANLVRLESGEGSWFAIRSVVPALVIVAASATAAGFIAHNLTSQVRFINDPWIRLFIGAGIGWLSVWIGGAMATAVAISLVVPISGPILALAISVAAILSAAAVGEPFSVVGVFCASMGIAIVRVALFPYPFPGVLGFAPGILLVSLTIRFVASCRHPLLGLRALPANFRRLTLCTSPLQLPELIPGLPQEETRFNAGLMIDKIKGIGKAEDVASSPPYCADRCDPVRYLVFARLALSFHIEVNILVLVDAGFYGS